MVAAAYTAGRLGHASSPWADWVFWLGEALILVPAAIRLMSRRTGTGGQVLAVVVLLTAAESPVPVRHEPPIFDPTPPLPPMRRAP